MALVWFLIFYLLLVAASTLAEFQENELQLNQSAIHLNLYHVQRPGSSLTPNSTLSFSEVLSRDEERVNSLSIKLVKGVGSTSTFSHKSGHQLGPKFVSIPLNSGLSIGSGNYYVKVGLGTPAKYYSLLMDTGSSFSWLQCQPCAIYCHAQVDPLFDPSTSKTYKSLSCTTSECSSVKAATLNDPHCEVMSNDCVYTASYGDSSYSIGYLSQDLLTLTPSQTLPQFVYGCGQDNEGLFGRASGILGLARHKLSMLAQLSTKYGYAFSYCLPRAAAASGGGGFLSIGKTSLASYKFTPMITDSQSPSLYFLRLTAITVGGRPLTVATAQYKVPTIIDSGTVITRLPMSLYAALQQAFVKIMSTKYVQAPAYSILDTCFKGSLKSMQVVPQIRMVFQGGADLTLGASNILIEADKGVMCLAFAGANQISIIGNHQQQTFNVAYDVSSSRIGFAANGCR